MILLVAYYIQETGQERVRNSNIMVKHELAYYEAQKIMLECNCLSQVLPHIFSLSNTLNFKH